MSKENVKIVKISTEYITLGQFLKFADVITNGGEAKQFIMTNKIFVNNELTTQRGKKLRDKDIVNINNSLFFEISK
ncbi:MAG: S4 domain-containing protein YaaA [Mollicutes bacterium]|nr:S4 domain-containing protein YaaA [Mollicutes bacterium]MDD7263824.1 S4 domain-containing protein YaaA [bacterium]MDY4979991.1 S4 domain-containing protein YaaA [Candidatus Onthovivens sp.]